MDDLLAELMAYERETITLRLDANETGALLAVLVECPVEHPYKAVAVALAERLAWERDRFALRERP
jgi:hypothetical protein